MGDEGGEGVGEVELFKKSNPVMEEGNTYICKRLEDQRFVYLCLIH